MGRGRRRGGGRGGRRRRRSLCVKLVALISSNDDAQPPGVQPRPLLVHQPRKQRRVLMGSLQKERSRKAKKKQHHSGTHTCTARGFRDTRNKKTNKKKKKKNPSLAPEDIRTALSVRHAQIYAHVYIHIHTGIPAYTIRMCVVREQLYRYVQVCTYIHSCTYMLWWNCLDPYRDGVLLGRGRRKDSARQRETPRGSLHDAVHRTYTYTFLYAHREMHTERERERHRNLHSAGAQGASACGRLKG